MFTGDTGFFKLTWLFEAKFSVSLIFIYKERKYSYSPQYIILGKNLKSTLSLFLFLEIDISIYIRDAKESFLFSFGDVSSPSGEDPWLKAVRRLKYSGPAVYSTTATVLIFKMSQCYNFSNLLRRTLLCLKIFIRFFFISLQYNNS